MSSKSTTNIVENFFGVILQTDKPTVAKNIAALADVMIPVPFNIETVSYFE